MTTKNIRKINVKINDKLDDLQKRLDLFCEWIKEKNGLIENLNKKIIIDLDRYIIIPKLDQYTTIEIHFKSENKSIPKLDKFEKIEWNIPNKEDLQYIFEEKKMYNSKNHHECVRFKNFEEVYTIVYLEKGLVKSFDTEYLQETCNNGCVIPIVKNWNYINLLKFIFDNCIFLFDYNKFNDLKELYIINKKFNFIIQGNRLVLDRKKIINGLKKEELKLDFNVSSKEIKEKLLNADKIRADIESYDEKMLLDPNRGNWDLWDLSINFKNGEEILANLDETLIARDPKEDIKKSGVVGIDFGTKSTVVVHQEKNDYTLPMRIGMGKFSKAIEAYHYENPTVMEFIDINSFMKAYKEKNGRPETKWSDLTISHTANNSLLNSSSEHYYSYFNELKQWCGDKDKKIRIKDKQGETFDLPSFLDIKNGDFNPIEIYAYYLGLYINNMHNGIYLKYILSFPVTYEKEIRDKVIKSFHNGIKKSLPDSLVEDSDIMNKFKVEEGANEPAAYAISALQAYGFDTEENEKVFYGVFDFGGGTTDFDFGIWRLADEDTEERYDYVIEHFGAGGDRYLGGENLLELLAFEIFKNNAETLRKNKISFTLPPECRKFPGSEVLLSNSEEAKLNMRQVMERLRPITEHHEGYEKLYSKGIIGVNLYDNSGKQLTNISLNIELEKIESVLRNRIEKGVRNFFESLRLSFNNDLTYDVEKINILLAGNSSKSKLVKEIFDEYIEKEEEKILKNKDEKGIFEVYPPLGTEEAYKKQEELGIKVDMNNLEKPTGKTGVAFGLIDSRKGGTIKVINKDIDNENNEVKFKFFIGRKKRKKFKVVMDKSVTYDKWIKFIDASESEFEIYYTSLPEASTNEMSIIDVDRISLSIESENEDANIYIKAVSPNSIEYVVASEDGIENEQYLSEVVRVDLE